MSDCECLAGCPFFHDQMPIDSAMGQIYKRKYCLGDNTHCARFMVFKALGKGKSPLTLFPNMVDRAHAIIAGKES